MSALQTSLPPPGGCPQESEGRVGRVYAEGGGRPREDAR